MFTVIHTSALVELDVGLFL